MTNREWLLNKMQNMSDEEFVENFNDYIRVALKILFLPLVVGVGFEFIKFAGTHNNFLVRIVSTPGLLIQRLTTKEPDDKQIEVAICSLKAALPEIYPVEENVSGDSIETDNPDENKEN